MLLLPIVQAKTDSITLLTIGGVNDLKGGTADIFLEIKPGKGAIFIDSFPLTKLDTQISTRFANQVACDFLKKDCYKYDFFYTIRAKASMVGGPSAGAAITILTIGVLSNLELGENTVITGTINSGGLIGPVAGLEQKINAAIDKGFTKIIVPKWQSDINFSDIKVDKKTKIVKVKNLEEALYHFSGKQFSNNDAELAISKDYSLKMEEIANILCERNQIIKKNMTASNESLFIFADNFLNLSKDSDSERNYYSKASYCFSASLKFRTLEYTNKSQEELKKIFNETILELESFNSLINEIEIISLNDLETFMIVKERLIDAKNYVDDINVENISYSLLAYAKERLFSAVAWSKFFDLEGQKIELNDEHLRNVCLRKTAEAEERINYAELYLPGFLESVKKEVLEAFDNYNQEEFAICIFKASKAKAEANILLTALTTHQDDLENVLEEKFEAIKKILLEQEKKNVFPLLGYSYYEYAKTLIEYDTSSSLTFAEYALELGRLDLYFPKKRTVWINFDIESLKLFFFGLIIGASLVILFKLKNPGRFQEYRNLPGKKR